MIRSVCPLIAAFIAFSLALTGAAVAHADPVIKLETLPSIPDSEGFAAAFCGVSNGALLFAGGTNFPTNRPWEGGLKAWHDKVFVLPSRTGKWASARPLAKENGYGVSVTAAGGVVCIGGGNATSH
ncbi:MAG: galactose oxidase, partial [Opitutus sp.]|nr:galactose oxidase [Opitutus sp.]